MTARKVPAHVKAHATGRWAETIFRALSSRIANRWKFVSIRGANKAEWRGVVDLIAIRKNTKQPTGDLLKRGDLFDIVLIQIKGGSARGTQQRRLPPTQRSEAAIPCEGCCTVPVAQG